MPAFLPIVVSRASCSLPVTHSQVDTVFIVVKKPFPFSLQFFKKVIFLETPTCYLIILTDSKC